MIIDRCDLHIHTKYSFDSKASPLKYCRKAIKDGIKVICFTDHIEASYDKNTFDDFKFKRRIKEFKRLKNRFKNKLKVLIGYEIGEPHLIPEKVEYIKSLGFDMIIGSVHRPFRDGINTVRNCNLKEYLKEYYIQILKMVECSNFNMLGHMDFVKKITKNEYIDNKELFHKILDICIKKNIVLEINSSALRCGFNEPFPSYEYLKYYKDHGGKYIAINSDAHVVDDLGKDYYLIKENIPYGLTLCYIENGIIKEL